MDYLVIRKADGLVVNVIVWDGESPYTQEGCDVIPLSTQPAGVWIGWKYVDQNWIAPLDNNLQTIQISNEENI